MADPGLFIRSFQIARNEGLQSLARHSVNYGQELLHDYYLKLLDFVAEKQSLKNKYSLPLDMRREIPENIVFHQNRADIKYKLIRCHTGIELNPHKNL